MITLRIIDTNNNNYFPQKVENLNFKNIHYGGNSELSFKLNEDPSFQNHKVGLFNNIYLYNFSTLIWQGYITEFQRDYKNLNYNLRASGLLIDFTNKRIKKTYVLDDIGDFRNWNEKNNKQSDEILYGYSQAEGEKGVKISLLQRSYNANEDGLFEIKIDENIERLKARVLISQPANFTTKLVTLDENHSNPYTEKSWANAQKIDENVILDIIKTEVDKEIYAFNFTTDDGKWDLTNATISGGVLDIGLGGYGLRSSDAIWLSGVDDDFIIEVDFKQDSAEREGMEIQMKLVDDTDRISFDLYGGTNRMRIHYKQIVKAYQTFVDDTNWHTLKIRRVGTKFYFSIDGGSEISWDYGTKRALECINLMMHLCAGEYDTFKYSWQYASEEGQYQLNEKRYLQFRVECTANQAISIDKYFAQLENLKLLISDDEINAANILKDLLLNHTQKLDLDTTLIQDCFNYKDIELCESLDGWSIGEENLFTYTFDFSFDNGKWAFSNANISGGLLNITANNGYGQRSPDASWLSGSTNDFIIEADFKQPQDWAVNGIVIKLLGDALSITFDVADSEAGTYNRMRIVYDGVIRAYQTFNAGTTWHTMKIRRVGTIYYFSIDGGAEISWDYGTARAVENIRLSALENITTAQFDNFKYSWYPEEIILENTIVKEGSHSIKLTIPSNSINKYLLKTLSLTQNLQNKNLFRFWVRSTITGDILKAKFGENLRYQYEPDWSCQYQANQKPQDAEPIWIFTGTDYGSVSGGILTINKTGANTCNYTRTDIGHNVKGNTIVARVKVTNTAKTTFFGIYDGIAQIRLAIYTTKIEDYGDATNSYTIDMTEYRELWLTMKNNFWVLYVDGVLAMVGETTTIATKQFAFGMDGSAILGKSYWDYVYYYNLGFLRNKRIEKTINIVSANVWEEKIIDLNNFSIATRDAIKYIQFEVLTNDAFTFYIDQIRANFELTSAYYRDRTAPLNILEDVLAYQDYEWTILKSGRVKFFEVDRDEIDYICPIKNLTFEENSTSYFSKIYLVYFDAMMKRQEIELTDETSKIPFNKEHVIGLGGITDVGAEAIGEAQFEFHKKPRYQLDCLVDNFIFDKNGGRINPIEIEPNNNIKFLGIPQLPTFRIIATDYANDICRLTLETYPESTPNIIKSIIGVL